MYYGSGPVDVAFSGDHDQSTFSTQTFDSRLCSSRCRAPLPTPRLELVISSMTWLFDFKVKLILRVVIPGGKNSAAFVVTDGCADDIQFQYRSIYEDSVTKIKVYILGDLVSLTWPPSQKSMSNPLDAIPVRQRKPLRISTDIPLFVRCSSNPSSSSSSSTTQNTTPGITPSTGAPQYFSHVLCMHDFESSDPVQLSFLKGEVLTVVKQEHSGWWAAMRPQGDRIGWIPSSFVQPVDGNKIAEGTDEALAPSPYESLNNPPLSAVHDHWVPVYEDHAVRCQTFLSDARLLKRFERPCRSGWYRQPNPFYIKVSLTTDCETMIVNHPSVCQMTNDPPTG